MALTENSSGPATGYEGYVQTSEQLMEGTLGEVQRLRELVQGSGTLALESTLGLSVIGSGGPQDRVTHVTMRAVSFAVRNTAESMAESGDIDERTLESVRLERHRVVTMGQGGVPVMGRVRLVMPDVFSRAHGGRQITGTEHLRMARNSYGIARRLASNSFPGLEALLRYLTPGTLTVFSRFDAGKFRLDETDEGEALVFANPAEVEEIIRKERLRLKAAPVSARGGRRCPALDITDSVENLVQATWGLTVDIQEAQLEVRPRDRIGHLASSVIKRAGFRQS